jgi:hypothetical protein
MERKHSLDFRGITNAAHRIFILRHTQDLFRNFRRLTNYLDYCTPALLRILTPIAVAMGILAVTATVVALIYERAYVFLLVVRSVDD